MEDASDPDVSGDELRRWLDAGSDDTHTSADEDPHRRVSTRRRWLVAVVAPWVLLAAVAAAGRVNDSDATPAAAAPSPAAAPAPTVAAAPAPTAAPATPAPNDPPAAAAPTEVDPPAAVVPAAVGMVRDAVTTASGDVTTALDSGTPEQPRRLADDTWLVRVHAVVLHGDRRRWRSARHEVWAAPVGRRGGGVVGLDRPWRVAIADRKRVRRTWQPATGDLPAVRRALRDAGLPAGPRLRLERDPALPAVVRAVTGASSAWLRAGSRPRVLGTEGR